MAEMQVAVVGAGPVGTLFVAALASNGCQIDWLVRSPERRNTAAQQRLACADQLYVIPQSGIRIIGSAAEARASEWLVIAVKAQQVAAVQREIPAAAATNRLVAVNGLVSGAFHLGLLYGGAYLDAGTVITTAANQLVIGALKEAAGNAQQLGSRLEAPWMHVSYDDDIELRQWHKLALNCAVNPLTTMLDCSNGHLLDHVASPLVQSVLAEACQLAMRRFGERWVHTPASLMADLISLLEATADNSSSMRQDYRAGRETEIEYMNLALCSQGESLRTPCPVNGLLGNMICLLTNRGSL